MIMHPVMTMALGRSRLSNKMTVNAEPAPLQYVRHTLQLNVLCQQQATRRLSGGG